MMIVPLLTRGAGGETGGRAEVDMSVCQQLRKCVKQGQCPHPNDEPDAAAPRDSHGVVERRGNSTVSTGEKW